MQLTKHWAAVLEDYVIDLAWSPDGHTLGGRLRHRAAIAVRANSGTRRHRFPGTKTGPIASLGTRVPRSDLACAVWSGQDGAVKFWDRSRASTPPRPSSGKPGSSTCGRTCRDLRPTRMILQTALPRGGIRSAASFVNADGTVAHTFKPAPKTLSALAWQPAGGCLAAAYFGGVCLWDADDFIAQKEYPTETVFTPWCGRPTTAGLFRAIRIRACTCGFPRPTLELHMSGYEGKVKELSFDPTSRWLATGGGKEACIWDCTGEGPEGREPVMLPHEGKVCAVAFQTQTRSARHCFPRWRRR